VSTPTVACSTADAELTNCIAEAFKQMHFQPSPGGTVTFTVPVVMREKH
jgi:hypothetical protein